MRTRDIKARAEELAEGYEDAYNQEFNDQFRDFISEFMSNNNIHYVTGKVMIITEDDIQGFMDSFTFPEEGDWAFAKVEEEISGYEDAKYDEMRDERCGL